MDSRTGSNGNRTPPSIMESEEEILSPLSLPSALSDQSIHHVSAEEIDIIETERTASSLSPRPDNLICCSLVSTGGTMDCRWQPQTNTGASSTSRCRSFNDRNSIHEQCAATNMSRRSSVQGGFRPLFLEVPMQRRQSFSLSPRSSQQMPESFLPSHHVETCSNTATRGSVATFMSSTTHDQSPSSEVGADQQQSQRLPSYYVIENRPTPFAYYVHQHGDAREQNQYNLETTPVTIGTTLAGKPAYIVELSMQHQGLQLYKQRNSESTIRVPSPSDLIDESIHEKVREQIECRRLEHSQLHIVDETGTHTQDSNEIYLINDDDLRLVVDTIANEMKGARARGHDGKAVDHQLRERISMPKLRGQNIMPCPAAKADPATTIALPRTSYAYTSPGDMKVHTKMRETETTTTSTVVTRKSVAEITWTQGGQGSISSSREASAPGSSTSETTLFPPAKTIPDVKGSVVTSPNNFETVAEGVADMNRAQADHTSDEQHSEITTFPQLRSCTNEWLNPPMEIEQLVEPPRDDLYHQGVDAHCGVSRPSIPYLEEPRKPPHCNHGLFDKDPFHVDESRIADRRASVASSTPAADKRTGQMIRVASHRRRSSQAQNQLADVHEGLIPTLMDILRSRGHKIFHRHKSHGSSERGSIDAPTPYNSTQNHSSRIRSRDSADQGHSPGSEATEGDNSSTVLMLKVARKRHDTCSEDDRPHACTDDRIKLGVETPTP